MYRFFICLRSILACWRQANVTPIPKGSSYCSVSNYPPISISPLLSNVFDRLVSVHLGQFMERSGVLPATNLLIGNIWVHVKRFCVCPTGCKVRWRVGRRLRSWRLTSVQPLTKTVVFNNFNVLQLFRFSKEQERANTLYERWSLPFASLVVTIKGLALRTLETSQNYCHV